MLFAADFYVFMFCNTKLAFMWAVEKFYLAQGIYAWVWKVRMLKHCYKLTLRFLIFDKHIILLAQNNCEHLNILQAMLQNRV